MCTKKPKQQEEIEDKKSNDAAPTEKGERKRNTSHNGIEQICSHSIADSIHLLRCDEDDLFCRMAFQMNDNEQRKKNGMNIKKKAFQTHTQKTESSTNARENQKKKKKIAT